MKKLGFGAMRLPLLDEEDKGSIDMEQFCQMVDCFIERGFSYFDTAYPYHKQQSETALREALVKRHKRTDFVLADKMPTILVKGSGDYPVFFEEQLMKCGVDYFDYYLLHNMGKERYANTMKWGGFDFVRKKKEEGLVKHIGFSFHDEAALLDRILRENPDVDFVQLQINYLDWNNSVIESGKCYETARRHNKPIIVMEPVKGGILASIPDEALRLFQAYAPECSAPSWAIRYAASLDGVMMVLSGMSALSHVKDNTGFMENFTPLNEEEHRIIREVTGIIESNTAVLCTGCQYCTEVCPKNINIPSFFSLYNSYKATGKFNNMYYNRYSYNRGKASDCIQCGRCIKNCPQHINIPEKLKDVAALE